MVASRPRGFSCKSNILFAVGEFSSRNKAKSLCVKEKKATSEPDIMAEAYKSRIISKNAKKSADVKAAAKKG